MNSLVPEYSTSPCYVLPSFLAATLGLNSVPATTDVLKLFTPADPWPRMHADRLQLKRNTLSSEGLFTMSLMLTRCGFGLDSIGRMNKLGQNCLPFILLRLIFCLPAGVRSLFATPTWTKRAGKGRPELGSGVIVCHAHEQEGLKLNTRRLLISFWQFRSFHSRSRQFASPEVRIYSHSLTRMFWIFDSFSGPQCSYNQIMWGKFRRTLKPP